MIKGEWRQLVDSEPPFLFRIISCGRTPQLRAPCKGEHLRNGSSAGIAPRTVIGVKFHQPVGLYAGLFSELSPGGLFKRFIHIHESTRKRPHLFEGLMLSLYEKDFTRGIPEICYNDVGRDGRTWILVSITHRFL